LGIILTILRIVGIKDFGIPNFNPFWMPVWLKKIHQLDFQIALTGGKAKSKGKIKKLYRQLLKCAQKAHDYMIEEINRFNDLVLKIDIAPSVKMKLTCLWESIHDDIQGTGKVLYYAENRIFNDVVLPSTQKILSVGDQTAAYIKKGNRTPVIGYKPQVSRSGNGFIPAFRLPLGNASDSIEFIPVVKKSIDNTEKIPCIVNVDDGYASKDIPKSFHFVTFLQNADFISCLYIMSYLIAFVYSFDNSTNCWYNIEKAKKLGISVVSISGAKGKKITPVKEWESDEYKKARADRSAVESIMFTLKYSYDFGIVRRRGIENVYAELLEKVIVYNFARIVLLQEREKQKQKLLA
jgi:hypothetical protein